MTTISFSGELRKRLKTFGWNVGLILLVALLNAVSTQLDVLALPDWAVALIGLLLAQATKFISNVKLGKVR
mgnify:CR=1 FL=1